LKAVRTVIRLCPSLVPILLTGLLFPAAAPAQSVTLDLATAEEGEGTITRVYGSTGMGFRGVPVAGGADCDGDGFEDFAVAYFLASPLGRLQAGEIDLVFGDGTIGPFYDTAILQPSFLRIFGVGITEMAGDEIWIDDVTGDGLGDLLIGRQNFTTAAGRVGAGALTILIGGAGLREMASQLNPLDLKDLDDATTSTQEGPEIDWITFIGAKQYDRLGIWMRTGDVTGDEIPDIVVGADQADLFGVPDTPDEANRGEIYVIEGGPHLAASQQIDLAEFGSTALAGRIARIRPPPGSGGYHVGSTCFIADLDGNGRGEVLTGAALNRSGAALRPPGAPVGAYQPTGGSSRGTLFLAWDDNFPPPPWPDGYAFDILSGPGSFTTIDGGQDNRKFAEEIFGGSDYDADGRPELFLGDLSGDGSPLGDRPVSGIGYVFYDASTLRGLEFNIDDTPPPGVRFTTILGATNGAIGGDTVTDGDLDGDGIADLIFGNPHDDVLDRDSAGSVVVFYGQQGGWPLNIDTSRQGMTTWEGFRYAFILGAKGRTTENGAGDTLSYSLAAGDVNGDQRTDIIVNEMTGDGLAPGTLDVGNLVVVNGAALLDAPNSARRWHLFNGSVD